jgi:hypothetical protein
VDGVTGFVIPAADTTALAHSMLTLAANPNLRTSMGSRGAERVQGWGHDTYASEMERLVSGCLAVPRRRSLSARAISAVGRLAVYLADTAGDTLHREFS